SRRGCGCKFLASCILRFDQSGGIRHSRRPTNRAVANGTLELNIGAWLAKRSVRALARWGELGCDVLLERSLQDELPALTPPAEATLRLAVPDDVDEITRLYSSDP